MIVSLVDFFSWGGECFALSINKLMKTRNISFVNEPIRVSIVKENYVKSIVRVHQSSKILES